MKKLLLTMAAFAAVASASAIGLKAQKTVSPRPGSEFVAQEFVAPMVAPGAAKSALRAEGETEEALYMPSYTPQSILGFNSQRAGMQIAMAMQIDPNFVKDVNGGEITSILFYTGGEYGSQGVNKITKATVFITDDLQGDFQYTQETTCPGVSGSEVNVTLDTPFVIDSSKEVYVGYYVTLNGPYNFPIVVDGMLHNNDYGGWVANRAASNQKWSWQNAFDELGFMCIGATVRSNSLTKNSVSITAIDAMPVAYQNTDFETDILFTNNGVNDVTEISLEYGIEGEETITADVTMGQAIPFLKSAIVQIPDLNAKNPTKETKVNVKVTKVNGAANTVPDGSNTADVAVTILPTGKGFDRNVVIEEFTSILCQYCPIGYTGMEYVHTNYPDGDLIPVGVHCNALGSEPMTAASYLNVYNNYGGSGVPSAVMNRTYDVYPQKDEIVSMFENVRSIPAIASVKATASFNQETREITIDTKTAFGFDYTDGASKFALSYGITEDNVGPYNQTNGYSGRTGDYEGWESQPASVSLIYNDVARQLNMYRGVSGSVPNEITAGTEYDFTRRFTLVQSISNVNHINVVVYLLNKETGAIENACTVKTADIAGLETGGVEDVTADGVAADAPVEYFNLQGIRVANPQGGIFIRRQGARTTKVAL